jgi:5-carboxymethyl-2-hydroxymuconate isomerase
MPHITLECSDNVEMDFTSFFRDLASELVATGEAAKLGIKCRVVRSEQYYIIDGDENYKMVNLLFRLREGRSNETLSTFSNIGMNIMEKYLQNDVANKKIILSTEIKELKKGIDLTKNSVR